MNESSEHTSAAAPKFSASAVVIPIVTGVVGFAAGYLVQDVSTAINPGLATPTVTPAPTGSRDAERDAPLDAQESIEEQETGDGQPATEDPAAPDDTQSGDPEAQSEEG